MSKKSAILIILLSVIIVIAGLIAWYLFLSPQSGNTEPTNQVRNLISSFFPRGETPQTPGTSTTTPGTGENTENNGDEITNQPAPVIREVSSSPVSGFTLLDDKKEGASVRYMETETGNTYSALLSILNKNRLTNTTIPKVYESLWLPGGNTVIARYLDESGETIKSFKGTLNIKKTDLGTITEGTLQGSFLRDTLVEIVASPSAEKIFYLAVENSGAVGIVANPDGSKPAKVFSSPVREWLPQWASVNGLYLNTKASAQTPGYLFRVDATTGAQTKIFGGTLGLTTKVNPKGDMVLYSTSQTNGFRTFVYNTTTKTSDELTLQTLPEKCVWDSISTDIIYCGVPNNPEESSYPDSWYKGIVSFNDELWKINIKTGEVVSVAAFKDITNVPVDITKPQVSKSGEYVVFVNKNNLSLWSIKVK